MRLIDISYFTGGDTYIEGLVVSDQYSHPANKANVGRVEEYINKYETEYLYQLLGIDEWVKFRKYLDENSEEKDEIYEELKRLLTEFHGIEKASPIASYVFFFYVRANQTRTTPLGVTVTNSDNRIVSANAVCTRAWNDMVSMTREIACFVRTNLQNARIDNRLLEGISTLGI